MLVYAPAYAFGRFGAKLAEDEEETQAQNKVVFGLLSMVLVFGGMGVFVWAMLWYTPIGALLATTFVVLFARYHNTLINGELYRYLKSRTLTNHDVAQTYTNSAYHRSVYSPLADDLPVRNAWLLRGASSWACGRPNTWNCRSPR